MTKFTSNTGKVIAKNKEATIESCLITAIKVTAQAKQLCPVAEKYGGNLKGSIQYKSGDGRTGGLENENELSERVTGIAAIVGTPVEYGVYQEFGTRKMNAQPFLRPAIDIVTKGSDLRQAMYKAFFDTVARIK